MKGRRRGEIDREVARKEGRDLRRFFLKKIFKKKIKDFEADWKYIYSSSKFTLRLIIYIIII